MHLRRAARFHRRLSRGAPRAKFRHRTGGRSRRRLLRPLRRHGLGLRGQGIQTHVVRRPRLRGDRHALLAFQSQIAPFGVAANGHGKGMGGLSLVVHGSHGLSRHHHATRTAKADHEARVVGKGIDSRETPRHAPQTARAPFPRPRGPVSGIFAGDRHRPTGRGGERLLHDRTRSRRCVRSRNVGGVAGVDARGGGCLWGTGAADDDDVAGDARE
mmetsp:Transcript_39691/g.67656  ORF Transcript_39691/g.67656 Transcript_39691/m.67656 type:complete len:215 (-) Transcript_39691:432-1076(-)